MCISACMYACIFVCLMEACVYYNSALTGRASGVSKVVRQLLSKGRGDAELFCLPSVNTSFFVFFCLVALALCLASMRRQPPIPFLLKTQSSKTIEPLTCSGVGKAASLRSYPGQLELMLDSGPSTTARASRLSRVASHCFRRKAGYCSRRASSVLNKMAAAERKFETH